VHGNGGVRWSRPRSIQLSYCSVPLCLFWCNGIHRTSCTCGLAAMRGDDRRPMVTVSQWKTRRTRFTIDGNERERASTLRRVALTRLHRLQDRKTLAGAQFRGFVSRARLWFFEPRYVGDRRKWPVTYPADSCQGPPRQLANRDGHRRIGDLSDNISAPVNAADVGVIDRKRLIRNN